MQTKYNRKSPAVKRLMREAIELSNPTAQYYAQPLEDNLFEWHFTVSGPADSEFEGGRYHGRVILPPEYPMKPPSIILLTPNGRFEIGKKICLSMSAHHPETWQPSWSIRTVLLALIGFMPTKGGGAIGAVDYTPQERRKLASKSQQWQCDVCGVHSCTALAQAIETASSRLETDKEVQELASQIDFKGEQEKSATKGDAETTPTVATATENSIPPSPAAADNQPGSNDDVEQQTAERVAPTQEATDQSSTVRQRAAVRAPLPGNAAVTTSQPSGVSNPGYCSLVLMWIVALALVVLIIRRLCLDTVTIQQA